MVFKIVKYAFGMVFNNLSQAIRISFVLYLVTAGLEIAFNVYTWGSPIRPSSLFEVDTVNSDAEKLDLSLYILLSVLNIFITAWIAVVWHRFILLEEYPNGYVPELNNNLVLRYIWASIKVAFIIVLISIAVIGIAMLALLLFPTLIYALLLPIIFACAVVMTAVLLRVGLIFPATAIGRNMKIAESWGFYTNHSKQLFGISAIVSILMITFVSMLGLLANFPILQFFAVIVLGWMVMMFNVSLLTTLYGIFVEKRELG